MALVVDDIRTSSPIATRSEVSALVGVQRDRLYSWTRTTAARSALVHATATQYSRLTVPLVGIAEASALKALLEGGMTFPEVKRAVTYIREVEREEYALASRMLLTDGAEAFIQDVEGLRRLRDNQGAFSEVLRAHLRPLIMGEDGFVEAFLVERFSASRVTIDPRFNAGQMSFERNRVPLFTIAGALRAGERPSDVASDYDLADEEVADVARNVDWLANFG